MSPPRRTLLGPADPPTIARAAAILRAGGLVALPTETVYGLAADGLSPRAVAGIFAAKGRPADNPLILHIAGLEALEGLVRSVPAAARALAAALWPGPLTLVLPRSAAVPELVTAGLDTVALRVPADPTAQAILRACGRPLAVPSANRSGRPSPTLASHVLEDLGGRIDLIVDGGPTAYGIESTVVDLSGETALLLREGAIPRERLRPLLEPFGGLVVLDPGDPGEPMTAAARSPGLRHRHYAPRATVELVAPEALIARARGLAAAGLRVGVLAGEVGEGGEARGLPREPGLAGIPWLALEGGLEGYARGLFAGLRTLDALGVERILATAPPAQGIGRALGDRLRRAAEGASQGSHGG